MHFPLYNANFSEPLTEQTGDDSTADEYEQPTKRKGTEGIQISNSDFDNIVTLYRLRRASGHPVDDT